MKIYTKTGDYGETSLFAGGRINKDALRLHAYGTIDELNAILGVVLSSGVHTSLVPFLKRIQAELFTLGADLATPLDAEADWVERVSADLVQALERDIDSFDDELAPLKNFILPGGTLAAAHVHQARTVCRRAERWMVSMKYDLNPLTLQYINRLSDWLFMIARVENHRIGQPEPIWKRAE